MAVIKFVVVTLGFDVSALGHSVRLTALRLSDRTLLAVVGVLWVGPVRGTCFNHPVLLLLSHPRSLVGGLGGRGGFLNEIVEDTRRQRRLLNLAKVLVRCRRLIRVRVISVGS